MPTLEEVRDDIAAFADDDEEIIVDPGGTVLFVRGGEDVSCKVESTADERTVVHIDGEQMAYRDFIVRYLARLDVFAERLLSKRSASGPFVDGPALLDSVDAGREIGRATELLDHQCQRSAGFTARVCFITADAGHGKTALLRHYQDVTATKFLAGQSPYLFWHLDLQGRQLLRLSEALMGDLGDLRVPGLWMPAVVRLLQHKALVLAIDGFDELAAEQGGTDALGALAMLVQQMDSRGTIVAASRRTFFDTEDYLKRSAVFRRSLVAACEFNQIALAPWQRPEAVEYLGKCEDEGRTFADPEGRYSEIVEALGGDDQHPMVTRPFLLTHIAKGLLRYELSAEEFVRPVSDPMGGVAEVVDAFVQREVATKWRYKDSGEPYLSDAQHMRLLADVAEEMYRAQKDRLDLEIVETLASILLEEWDIEPGRRQQIIEMVRMHVLLTIPADGDPRSRSFDHPEFRDYFIAVALRGHLDQVIAGGGFSDLARYLGTAQLSDSTARYVRRMVELSDHGARQLMTSLAEAVRSEIRPTSLHGNVGTLVAAVLDGLEVDSNIEFDAPAMFTSVVLERTRLSRVILANCMFVNSSFIGVEWNHVEFRSCSMGELTIDAGARFDAVTFSGCSLDGVRLVKDGEELEREYAPTRMAALLQRLGISCRPLEDDADSREVVDEPAANGPSESEGSKLAHRLLRIFNRSTVVTAEVVRLRFRQDHQRVLGEILPLLENCGIVKQGTWRGKGSGSVWSLQYPIDVVMAAEDGSDNIELNRFWVTVASI